MLTTGVQLLLSALLVCAAFAKMSFESPSRDLASLERPHVYWTNPNIVFARAAAQTAPNENIFRQLVETDAASAERWSQLGNSLAAASLSENARYCFLRAAELSPNTSETWQSVADFYIRENQIPSALPFLGKILRFTGRRDSAFTDFDALNAPFADIAAGAGLSDAPEVVDAYLQHLMQVDDAPKARDVWQWLAPRARGDKVAGDYIQFLLSKKALNEASSAWTTQLHTRPLVINGDFAQSPASTFFDWQIARNPHVEVVHDEQDGRSGGSLRLEFDGKVNELYEGVKQQTFLQRGAYKLTAFLRTKDITTDEGVGLRIVSTQPAGRVLLETERLNGSADWRELGGRFTIESSVELVEVQIVRRKSWRFDSLIAGAAWLDDVSLTQVN